MSSNDINNMAEKADKTVAPTRSNSSVEGPATIQHGSDGEKTPTQTSIVKSKIGSASSDGAQTPKQTKLCLAVPGSGLVRKSASTITLRADEADDVFGPAESSNASDQSSDTNDLNTISSRIRAGCLSIVPPHLLPSHAPRADRGAEINVTNAQGILPPDAVVFVANLSAARTADQLEQACHDIFDIFGENYIKVKYDKNKHPFGLVQYQNADAAAEAICNNNGAVLDGRSIRLEQGKAERALVITKNDGSIMPEAETRRVLGQFGALESVVPTTAVTARITSLPGWCVTFAYYQDCQDALKQLTTAGSGYRLQLATGLEEEARRAQMEVPLVPTRVPHVSSRPPPRSNTDIKSIFIGNLPLGTSRQELVDIFAVFGQIMDVNVITKRYDGGSTNVFGFVEFVSSTQAEAAAYTEKWLGGQKLRIEPKEYTSRRSVRISQGIQSGPPAPTPYRAPRYTPRRVTPHAVNALSARLAANNIENLTPGYTPPTHLLPAGLFSPNSVDYYPPMTNNWWRNGN